MHSRINRLISDVLRGSESVGYRPAGLRRVLCAEEGLLTWATLVAVILFCTLIAMVFNVGRIVNDKLEVQNAADSTAYSASLVQARALNAITSANHMMGELTALYVMHHAIGGKVLDDGGRKDNLVVIGLNIAVNAAYVTADIGYVASLPWSAGNIPVLPGDVGWDIPKGEATVYDAKCLLKAKMIQQYIKYDAASAKIVEGDLMLATILLAAAGAEQIAEGVAEQAAANAEMRAIKQEYAFITRLESFAINTRSIKKNVIPALLDGLWNYEKYLAGDLIPTMGASRKADEAGKFAATKNIAVGEVLGRPTVANAAKALLGQPTATLAIVQDPTQSDDRTQLIRATYPWVQEWRWPLLIGFDVPFVAAPRSRASRFYEYHTDRYTKEICDEFRKKRNYKLYVLEEMDATKGKGKDKGTETWRRADQSLKADQMFAVVGLARKQKPPAMSHITYLPNTNPEPMMAMAQAIVYNANNPKPWEPKHFADSALAWLLGRKAQPVPAWDTLNWTEGATEWKKGKPYFELFNEIFSWFPSFLPQDLLQGMADDLRWVMGFATPLDAVFPPDVPIPIVGGGVPTPKVSLNWQAKLVPISTKNLLPTLSPKSPGRLVMVHDSKIKKRMVDQVLPAALAQQLGVDFVHH